MDSDVIFYSTLHYNTRLFVCATMKIGMEVNSY